MKVFQRAVYFFSFCLITLQITGMSAAQTLPSFSTSLFAGPGDCQFCHAAGTGTLVSSTGEDVSPPAHWRSSMMANAAKDPFWRAKVAAEILEHPAIASAIEDKCTTCHAPMGHRQSREDGQAAYSIINLTADTAGLDGVSCTACHQVQDNRTAIDESFSGHYSITANRLIYGPYENPNGNQMKMRVNFTPAYSNHVESSELCAVCHTLFTSYVDNDGNLGGTFPEQTPYLEWKNSRYPNAGESCQSCHMPSLKETTKISLRPVAIAPRNPVWRHEFIGGNTLLPAIIAANQASIGAYSGTAALDMTVMNAREMLTGRTAVLSLAAELSGDSLFADVAVTNLCGHKFPTGYPGRQAWIHLTVADEAGAIIFESGTEDSPGSSAVDSFRPHFDYISDPSQVQIYEPVMGDVDGVPTATLLRGASYLKDNRIPPAGFVSDGNDYASIAIIGEAVSDPDFNRTGVDEGSGADTVHYRILLGTVGGTLNVTASLRYRSISERFAAALFAFDDPAVASFKGMYDAAGTKAETIDSTSLIVEAPLSAETDSPRPSGFTVGNFPNPFNAGTTVTVSLPVTGSVSLIIYNVAGQRVTTLFEGSLPSGTYTFAWNGRADSGAKTESGIYFVKAQSGVRIATTKMLFLE